MLYLFNEVKVPDTVKELGFVLQKARDSRYAFDLTKNLIQNAKPVKTSLPFAKDFCRQTLYYNPNAGNEDVQKWRNLNEVLDKSLADSILLKFDMLVNSGVLKKDLANFLLKQQFLSLNVKDNHKKGFVQSSESSKLSLFEMIDSKHNFSQISLDTVIFLLNQLMFYSGSVSTISSSDQNELYSPYFNGPGSFSEVKKST
jgi:hypothetical protein